MNIYHVIRNSDLNYDEYSDFVTIQENEEAARTAQPEDNKYEPNNSWSSWVEPKDVTVVLIGTALPDAKAGCICSSFHAG